MQVAPASVADERARRACVPLCPLVCDRAQARGESLVCAMHAARAAARRAKSQCRRNLLYPGSLRSWKGLFWRWKGVRPETRLVVAKSGAMARFMMMEMEMSVRSLLQTVQKQVRARMLSSASLLIIIVAVHSRTHSQLTPFQPYLYTGVAG
jgi:hypothetical protein